LLHCFTIPNLRSTLILGARVYVTGRREEVLAQTVKTWGSSLAHPQGKLIAIPCDVRSKDSIMNLVNEIEKNEKHVDVLVNNAGISEGTSEVEKGDEGVVELQKELWQEDPAKWANTYETNVMRSVHNIFLHSGI